MKNFYLLFSALCIVTVTTFCMVSCQNEDEEILSDKVSTVVRQSSNLISSRSAGPSANGQGTLVEDYLGNQPQHFSFHANTDQNGTVTGTFESSTLGLDSRVHGKIDCLNVLPDGKTAVLSGVITIVTGDFFVEDIGIQVGYPIWFKVQDNGEGAKSVTDKFSDGYIYFELPTCTSDFDVDMMNIANGNIQVKP